MDLPEANRWMDRAVVWVAQGFGVGRIPFAPGTFGSGLGLVWLAVLLRLPDPRWMLLAMALSVGLSVWFCGWAETALQQKDPGSVVLDEVVAVPVCFIALAGLSFSELGRFPGPDILLRNANGLLTALAFGLFRLFDIWKPWPVGPSQRLPAGWGITVDDLLAAVYVNLALVFLHYGMGVAYH